jgi:hypothetical protein
MGVCRGAAGKTPVYQAKVQPLLNKYCYACHGEKKKGDLDLRLYANLVAAKKGAEVFDKVVERLESRDMPPEGKSQPSTSERKLLLQVIRAEVLDCDCDHPDPGRVTIRRLNRVEYNNTIRDLVGVDFRPADDFPVDDVGYGFDNIGDVLALSPLLFEKYMSAAAKIMDKAIVTALQTSAAVKHIDGMKLNTVGGVSPFGEVGRMMYSAAELSTETEVTKRGEYEVRVRAFGQQAGPEPVRLEVRIDDKVVKELTVKAVESHPELYSVRIQSEPGTHKIAVAFVNDYYNPDDPNPENRDRNAIVDFVELAGPFEPVALPESHKKIFFRQPTQKTTNEAGGEIIAAFARRAYRRPLQSAEMEGLMKIFEMVQKDGGSFEASVKLALEAVLVSPHFLYRGEEQPQPDNPESVHSIDEYALATRLSYFLWSSMPDDELFRLAAGGGLRKNLEPQVIRMLKDPKAHALVENFADQWLQIRALSSSAPDGKVFPGFDEDLRGAMESETEMFFEYIMKQDRSVLEFLDSDYTFLNEQLAKLYGIDGVGGKQFRRVSFNGKERGGLLTQASILTLTSTSTRTAPVKRGKWILDNILGTPPPPPLPEVPPLKEGSEAMLTGSLRQRMEQHRADPNCANCHAKMDPIGFGFEHYDGIGAWRAKEGEYAIDATAQLVTGEKFDGAAEFKKLLLSTKRDQFTHCLSEKMLTYALGRGLERYDKCALDKISANLAKERYKFSALVLEVARSAPFQMRRGEQQR